MTDRGSYFARLQPLPKILLFYLLDMEAIQNEFRPTRLGEYAAFLRKTHLEPLATQAALLKTLGPPAEMAGFHEMLCAATEALANSARLFAEFGEGLDIGKALRSWRELGEALRHLYALRRVIPGLRQYWVLPEAFEAIDRYDPPPTGEGAESLGPVLVPPSDRRHWFARYVPEWYTPDREWPVVVALHGAWGRGDHFLWSWVRPAKTLGYIVLSPKSIDTTWTEADLGSVVAIIEETTQEFRVDRRRILLTGLSDGGIFTYVFGFQMSELFSAMAVISANFIPFLMQEAAERRPIYIMHGEADHMFPVGVARGAACLLQEHGHAVEYHERPEYGHFYPPEENVAILRWFERHSGHQGRRPQEPGPESSHQQP